MFIVEALQGSIPSLKLENDQRTRLNRLHDDMRDVMSCDLKVETPSDPLTPASVQGNSLPSVSEKTHYFDRASQDGV